jgi:hypothetical protein
VLLLSQIDEISDPQVAVCSALKSFVFLNRNIPRPYRISLPRFFDRDGKGFDLLSIVCADYPGDKPFRTWESIKGVSEINEVFDIGIEWQGNQLLFLIENHASTPKRILVLWLPKFPSDIDVYLQFVGTRWAEIEYLRTTNPLEYLSSGRQETHRIRKDTFHFPGFTANLFPPSALYVAEAHSAGTPFKRGLGILWRADAPEISIEPYFTGREPLEDHERHPYEMRLEDYALLPSWNMEPLEGTALYRRQRFARDTGWNTLLFGN